VSQADDGVKPPATSEQVPQRFARGTPAAEELGKRRSGLAVRWNRSEESEHGLALSQIQVRHFLQEPRVPTTCGSLVLIQLLVCEQQRQLECFSEANELEFRGNRKRLRDVPTIKSSTEAHVRRTLNGHETNVRTDVKERRWNDLRLPERTAIL